GVCKKFQDYLNRRLSLNGKFEVELKHLFSKFTGEVVANAGLGILGFCFEDFEDADNSMAFDQLSHSLFVPNLIEGFFMTFLFFFPEWNRLVRVKFVTKELEILFKMVAQKNLETRRKKSAPRNDFLQLMMDLEKSGEELDLETVAAHAFSFYMDGYQSSSIALLYIGYHLATHQDIQDRVRNEVKTVIEKHGGVLTYEGLKEMTYMEQVISESQRCSVGIGTMNKLCTEEFHLEGSDGLKYHAKPGTEIIIPAYALQRDPKYWPDPETFNPERFSEEGKKNNEKYAFLPFGDGPRMCVGMRMALLQMKACLATLLKDYKIELSPKTKLPLKISPIFFISLPIGGMWVNISKL
ncbi:cytochrome P450 3A19-like, partial [Ceratina calcarata]|uniref:Cytochrome P450 3A19-like n=1 Tax=Ceratina calcarata TaxID=156304 RepID=A0AAJ7J588_9HYME